MSIARLPRIPAMVILTFVSLLLVSACANDDKDDDASDLSPDDAGDDSGLPDENHIVMSSSAVDALITVEPFGWRLSSEDKGVFAETSDFGEKSSLFYNRDGKRFTLAGYLGRVDTDGGVSLTYRTSEDTRAKVDLSFRDERTFTVSLSLSRTDGTLYTGQDIRLFDGEAIYGLTERLNWNPITSEWYPPETGSLNRRGEWIPLIVYYSEAIFTPFHQSSNGYGLYVDTTFDGDYDVGRKENDRLTFRFWATRDRYPSLTYHVFYGPDHDTILDGYTQITGRPFIPPRWGFLHMRWRDEHALGNGLLDGHVVNAQLAEDVNMYDELDFPVGNYLIDRPWTPGDQGFAEFAWDTTRFPNPQQMLQSLFDRGYHFGIWAGPWAIGMDPGQNGYEAEQFGYFAPGGTSYIDFTNPAAFDWFKDKIRTFALANNVQEWKLDRGDEETPSQMNHIYWDGRSGLEMRNAYPVLYQKCFHDAMVEAWGDDFLNVYRAGFAGSQALGVANMGDVRGAINGVSTDLGLRSAIIAQQRLAFMGFPVWGSNTGGFEEFVDREVFARWLQFSAFSSIMDIGGVGNHAPWNMPGEPHYDEELIDIYRTYTTLHHDLVDYLYEYAKTSAQDGHAVVRPMVFEYPDDANVRDMWDEYFFGPDILVAPVWRVGDRKRDVYIPAGDFVDYWSPDAVLTGPRTVTALAPMDKIPFYIRKGATVLGRAW